MATPCALEIHTASATVYVMWVSVGLALQRFAMEMKPSDDLLFVMFPHLERETYRKMLPVCHHSWFHWVGFFATDWACAHCLCVHCNSWNTPSLWNRCTNHVQLLSGCAPWECNVLQIQWTYQKMQTINCVKAWQYIHSGVIRLFPFCLWKKEIVYFPEIIHSTWTIISCILQ